MTFPGAGGDDLHFENRDDLAPLYAGYSRSGTHIGGGHHTSNIAVNVRPDLTRADLSSYFMTSNRSGVQGGRYEGVMRLEADGLSSLTPGRIRRRRRRTRCGVRVPTTRGLCRTALSCRWPPVRVSQASWSTADRSSGELQFTFLPATFT